MGQAVDHAIHDPRRARPGAGRSAALVRPLGPGDVAGFEGHLLRLDDASRMARFAMPVADAFLARYAAQAVSMAGDTLVLAAVPDGEIRGAAELRLVGRREAEATFSVEPAFRRRGIGTVLFDRLLEAAGERRLKRLYMSCLARNDAMRALARRFGAAIEAEGTDPAGFATGVIEVPGGWFRLPRRPWP